MADLISLLLELFSPTPDTQPKIIIRLKLINKTWAGTMLYLLSLPTLTMLTPSKVVLPELSGGVLLRAMMPVSLGSR
jgi:hypothetical protein